MGYRVKKVSRGKGPQWKIQFITYRTKGQSSDSGKKPSQTKGIPKSE